MCVFVIEIDKRVGEPFDHNSKDSLLDSVREKNVRSIFVQDVHDIVSLFPVMNAVEGSVYHHAEGNIHIFLYLVAHVAGDPFHSP